jgi:hypothetical protein
MSISRRNFIRASAGAASAGLALDSALSKPLFAAEAAHRACPAEPQPNPHTIATPFGTTIHHFFPGPVEGIDPNTGHDPSEIFDFRGIIAQADLLLTGTGTDLNTGESAPYDFHTDMRFMKGHFVAADGNTHKGAFAFI